MHLISQSVGRINIKGVYCKLNLMQTLRPINKLQHHQSKDNDKCEDIERQHIINRKVKGVSCKLNLLPKNLFPYSLSVRRKAKLFFLKCEAMNRSEQWLKRFSHNVSFTTRGQRGNKIQMSPS